tara:strand:+ start:220 stop:486 length:267 start_codon:yes stop_codon:yes gene_type:complete
VNKLYLAQIETSGYNVNGCGETPLSAVEQLEISWNKYKSDLMYSIEELVENNGLTVTELKANTNWLEGNAPIYYGGYDLQEFKKGESK